MRPPNSQYYEHQILVGTEADPTPVRNRPRTRTRRRYSTYSKNIPDGIRGCKENSLNNGMFLDNHYKPFIYAAEAIDFHLCR